MRRIRIFEHIALDGVISPDGDTDFANGGWTARYRSAEGAATVAEAQGTNAATNYVATHRRESLEWGPVGDLGADVMAGICALKSTNGSDLIFRGSSMMTSALFEQGLVDEVVLAAYPALLGRGKRLFSESADPRELALISTTGTPTGLLVNTYRHVGSRRTE